MYVAVVGPDESARPDDLAAAREVGRLLAAAGAIVLTGGLGGVMAAATQAASEAGGITVALLPGYDRSVSTATVVIPTGMGELRNGLLVRAADAVIAIGGSWGTLSEVALARRTGVPLTWLAGWDLRDPDGKQAEIIRAATAAEAVATTLAGAGPITDQQG